MVDIWRDLHPLTPGFTWESPDHARASRIDLIGCPAVWAPFVSFCNVVPCPFSDHSVVHCARVRARAKWAEAGESSRRNVGRISGAPPSAWRMAPLSQYQRYLACREWSRIRGPCHLFIGGPTAQVPVPNITFKSCYDLVLGANRHSPHCELTFRPFLAHCTGLPLGGRSISYLWTARSSIFVGAANQEVA